MKPLDTVFKEYDTCLLEGRFDDAATTIKAILETNKENPQVYFWALKRFGDYIGYGYLKDYNQAIDIYQSIINDYDSEEDDLYEWCQLDIAKSYLLIGINAFQIFEEMTDIVEETGEERSDYFNQLVEKHQEYIEGKADEIQRARM